MLSMYSFVVMVDIGIRGVDTEGGVGESVAGTGMAVAVAVRCGGTVITAVVGDDNGDDDRGGDDGDGDNGAASSCRPDVALLPLFLLVLLLLLHSVLTVVR